MPNFDPKLLRWGSLSGRKQVLGTRLFDSNSITDKKEEVEDTSIKGVGLEKMGDKLDKLIVRPLKKPKNIKFQL